MMLLVTMMTVVIISLTITARWRGSQSLHRRPWSPLTSTTLPIIINIIIWRVGATDRYAQNCENWKWEIGAGPRIRVFADEGTHRKSATAGENVELLPSAGNRVRIFC